MSNIRLSKLIKEQSEPVDYQYFLEQVDGLIQAMQDFEQELSTTLEQKDEETGDSQYQQMQNQVARYMQGAERQIEGLRKMIDRKQNIAKRLGGI
jgi:phosphate uptake regulator